MDPKLANLHIWPNLPGNSHFVYTGIMEKELDINLFYFRLPREKWLLYVSASLVEITTAPTFGGGNFTVIAPTVSRGQSQLGAILVSTH